MNDARAALLAREDAVVRALVANDRHPLAPPPPGFAPGALDAAMRTLAGKRRAVAARILPQTRAALGDAFAPSFDAFARSTTPPRRGSSATEDAHAFLRWLVAAQPVDATVAREAVAFELDRRRVASVRHDAGRRVVGLRLAGRRLVFELPFRV